MKATILIAMLLSTSICATAADYTTPGDGSEYDFEKLSTISGSGVEKSESIYVINGTCTIATGDRFKIDSGATIEFDTDGELVIQGTADLQSESPTILRRHGTATGCIGISLQSSAVTEVSNLLFDYVGLRGQGTAGMNVSHCTFSNHSGTVSSALFTGGDGATFVIRDCTFDHCQKAAIGGAANYLCPVSIQDCVFKKNSQANNNIPQLNLTGAETITIKNCIVEGDSTLNRVGGIAIANWFGTEGVNVNIEGCTIIDNRYGITTTGVMDIVIKGNTIVNNKFEANPYLGGSGINLSDSSYKLNAVITGNRIERNLWGVTIIGCGDVNLGKTEIDAGSTDYNPGNNVFKDNGNGGTPYDLYNNSTNTVYAQGNYWSVPVQDAENIETVIFHKNDYSSLGEVIYLPAGNTVGIHSARLEKHAPKGIYRVDGSRVSEATLPTLPHGIYIIDGKKTVR